jgi:F-type H+-transporting ATPase subunit b
MKLFEALGLNWKILLAQLVNFGLLVWILHRYGYGPIIKFIDERRGKIEGGLEKARLVDEKMEKAKETEKEIIVSAKKEAQKIVSSSTEVAKKNQEEMINKAHEEAQRILESSEKKAIQEKDRIIGEAKEEVAELVVSATKKLIAKNVDELKNEK